MRVGLIGGVESSALTLRKLIEKGIEPSHVFGYKPTKPELVSGYCDLEPLCEIQKIGFTPFVRINEHIEEIKKLNLDYLLVVGISQLVSEEIINASRIASIGFHPTKLPNGRGRAPIAWLVNEVEEGAATFFMLDKVADAGDIVAQECFAVNTDDNAKSVEAKVYSAMSLALDSLIYDISVGEIKPIAQNESLVSEYGVRRPEDGLVDWSCSAFEIDRLIKSASDPHPGAFTYSSIDKLLIKSSRVEIELRIKGVQGRILKIQGNEALVQAGDGLIWVEFSQQQLSLISVGSLLGYKADLEINELKKQIQELHEIIEKLL